MRGKLYFKSLIGPRWARAQSFLLHAPRIGLGCWRRCSGTKHVGNGTLSALLLLESGRGLGIDLVGHEPVDGEDDGPDRVELVPVSVFILQGVSV